MIFYFIPFWVIGIVILIILALLHWVSMNIVTILLIIVGTIVAIILLFRWPKQVIALAVAAVLLYSGWYLISEQSKINNQPVTISRAVRTCVFFDESGTKISIPAGAIVAQYTALNIESKEKHSNVGFKYGGSYQCSWYYDGYMWTSSIGRLHEPYFASEFKYEKNRWNLEPIEEITYKEYKKGNWWK